MNIQARCRSFIRSNVIARIFQGIFRERKVKIQGLAAQDVNGLAQRARYSKTLS